MKLTKRKVPGGVEYSISGTPQERYNMERDIIMQLRAQSFMYPRF
jgi:hypothetical protein